MKKEFKEIENENGITAQTTDRERILMAKEFAKKNPGDTSGCEKIYEYREGESHLKPAKTIIFKRK
jgi:hypothetical protein